MPNESNAAGSDFAPAYVYGLMDELASIEEAAPFASADRRPGNPSDRRLLQEVRRGSREAAEALIERHWDRAHRIAHGILGDAHAAEDVTQEAMLSILGSVGRFDLYRPFGPWLHRVVSNRALDWARTRARRGELPIEVGSFETASEETAFGGADPALEAALAALTPEHRAVVVLRFVAGYGPKQIAGILGVPIGTVGSRLRRALDQLRVELEADDG
jgi:RNA polymerase sigma-70 factor, ECF subfamily